MSFWASECSSDCESGWTHYLEQSSNSPKATTYKDGGTKFVGDAKSGFCEHKGTNANIEEEGDKEEDLSMVSDASSGPPQFNENGGYFNSDNAYFPVVRDAALKRNNGGKRQKMKGHWRGEDQELPSCLDDTASSSAFNFSKNHRVPTKNQASMESVFDYSQGFSATHFEDPFSYAQPPLSGNRFQNNQSKIELFRWFGGRGMR